MSYGQRRIMRNDDDYDLFRVVISRGGNNPHEIILGPYANLKTARGVATGKKRYYAQYDIWIEKTTTAWEAIDE